MAERSSLPVILAVVIAFGAALIGLLVVIPIVAILSGAGPLGDDPKQTPFVTDSGLVTVKMRDFSFSPTELTVNAGTQITWTNEDSAPHDATHRDNAWATERLSKGDQGTITFSETGTYHYYCTIHPYMEAVLTVR